MAPPSLLSRWKFSTLHRTAALLQRRRDAPCRVESAMKQTFTQ